MNDVASPDAAGPVLIPLKGLRGAIARNMSQGWQAPRVAMMAEADMTAARALISQLNAESPVKITVTAVILRALALSLREFPELNAAMREGGIERLNDVNLGLAVSLPQGLMVPVIRQADQRTIPQLAAAVQEVSLGAREGKLPTRAYQGGSFTVSNLGMTAIDQFTPIINPPQVGIVGVSRTADRVVAKNGQVTVAPMMGLSLVFDHRAVDGYPAARFLSSLKQRLEAPEGL